MKSWIGYCITVLAAVFSVTVVAGDLQVTSSWARASIPGAANGAAYVSLINEQSAAKTIVEVTSNVSKKTELHKHVHEQGMMKMVHVPELKIASGESLKMKPGGYHIMLFNLQQPLTSGDQITLTFMFSDGESLDVSTDVRKSQ
ncbi:MAG: copper chaperone PCu(A)C [Pseudomonadota bacterium]